MPNPFAPQVVGAPEPAEETMGDIFQRQQEAFQRSLQIELGTPPDQLVEWFLHTHIPQLIEARKRIAVAATKRMAVEPVLQDPQHFEHPARQVWVSQYAAMCDAEQIPIELAMVEIHHLYRTWLHFVPYERKAYGLDIAVGVHGAVKHLGRELAFIAKGPIQDASPLPSGYEPPPGCFARLPPNLVRTIDQVPF